MMTIVILPESVLLVQMNQLQTDMDRWTVFRGPVMIDQINSLLSIPFHFSLSYNQDDQLGDDWDTF